MDQKITSPFFKLMENFEKRRAIYLHLGFREEAISLLKAYMELLWSSNEKLNLFSRKMTEEELIDNHLIDCLLPLTSFKNASKFKIAADFGSGGGLPGVLYALQFPEITFRLFEKSPKKREFLLECCQLAPNLEVHGEISDSELEGVELVMARAFKPIDVILDMSRKYYQKGGRYFLLKGRRDKIDEELVLSSKKFKDIQIKIEVLKSPIISVERHLVLINWSQSAN